MDDKTVEFHLCEAGQRLWDEWKRLRTVIDALNDCLFAAIDTGMTFAVNQAWLAYQDHRAACDECTKMRAT
jgi:hypothetical protein